MSEAYKPKAKIPFEWEKINEGTAYGSPDATSRAKVPGGWLIYTHDFYETYATTITFVADPNHEWEVK